MAKKAEGSSTRKTTTRKKTAATGRSSTRKSTSAAKAVVAEPTRDDVARKAYEIYCQRCQAGRPGNAEDDWTAAELELRNGSH